MKSYALWNVLQDNLGVGGVRRGEMKYILIKPVLVVVKLQDGYVVFIILESLVLYFFGMCPYS